jgi:hypothetical protein
MKVRLKFNSSSSKAVINLRFCVIIENIHDSGQISRYGNCILHVAKRKRNLFSDNWFR